MLADDAAIVPEADSSPRVTLDGDGDYVSLGRIDALDDAQQLDVTIDFQRSQVEAGTERLLWNHGRFGIALEEDTLLLHVAGEDRPFHDALDIDDAGVGDTQEHSLHVAVDAGAGRIQAVLDGEIILDEDELSLDLSYGNARDWWIGTPWNRFYEGDVDMLELDDRATFLDDPLDLA